MKKTTLRITAAVLALVMLCLSAVSCSSGKTLMSLGKQSISLNLYELYLSRQKGTLCTTYYYGSKAKYDEFWQTTISVDGTTYNDYWTSYILECAKIYLAALYMFEEEYKLELPQSAMNEVQEKLDELILTDGDGSKTALNAVLAEYGVNYDMLREAYIVESKVSYLQEYLYGANAELISDQLKEQYYQENYVRFKQVFLAKYHYVYETDADGNVIYYEPGDGSEVGDVLYDKTTGIRKFDENGKALKDEAGNVIYYNEDGTVAYDTVNGVPAHTYDENGYFKTENYAGDELKKIKTQAEDIAEFTEKGDIDTFEQYVATISEDGDGQTIYPEGYYFSIGAQYSYEYIVDIISELCEMEVGELRVVESEYGYHVIMKYELDEGAYAKSENSVWFESESYSFNSDVTQWLFNKKCESYLGKIEIDTDVLSERDIKSVSPNYYY